MTTIALRKSPTVEGSGPFIRKSGLILPIGATRDGDNDPAGQFQLPTLAINQRIIPVIVRECERFKRSDLETGSVLLGRTTMRNGQRQISIEVCLPPGESLNRQRASFSQDSSLHDELLQCYQRTDPFIQYLGDWHRHQGMPKPSYGDLMTANSVLDDDDFGVDELLVVIACHFGQRWFGSSDPWFVDALRRTPFDHRDYSVRFFYLAKGMRRFAELQPEPYLRDADYQTELSKQWYTSADPLFERELRLLEEIGCPAEIRIVGTRPNLSFVFSDKAWHNQLIFTTGPRYPQQQPGGFVVSNGKERPFSPRVVGLSWNSECTLARLLVASLSYGLHTLDFE